MRRKRIWTAFVTAALLGVASGCGGDGADGGGSEDTGEYVPQSADYELAQRSDLGIKGAVATVSSNADGTTSVILNFYVPNTPETDGDLYRVSIRSGQCSDLGDVTRDIGEVGSGINTVPVDAPYDDVNEELASGESSVVIVAPGDVVAWCGPGP